MDTNMNTPNSLNKPWAKLKLTRKQYAASRPWKRSGMPRKTFEDLVLTLPDTFFEGVRLEADAEKLLEGIFGQIK